LINSCVGFKKYSNNLIYLYVFLKKKKKKKIKRQNSKKHKIPNSFKSSTKTTFSLMFSEIQTYFSLLKQA
jgi:hypothetical protein